MSRLIRHSKLSLFRICSINGSRHGRFLPRGADTNSKFSTKSDKIEEAETVHVRPPPTEKLLVLGGNGFVGSHVCKEALDRGLTVASLSRSGRSSIEESWANNITWHQGNLFSPDSWKDALEGVTSIISCVGGFGSHSQMYKINGTANINAVRAASKEGVKRFVYISAADFGFVNYFLRGYYEGKRAAESELLTRYPYNGVKRFVYISAADFGFVNYFLRGYYEGKRAAESELLTRYPYNGVKRFVYISAADFGFVNYFLRGYYEGKRAAESELLTRYPYNGVKRFVYISAADFGFVNYFLRGYYEGKRAAESELLTRYPYNGVILRPGFIYGNRRVGSLDLPLGVIGYPLQMLFQYTKALTKIPHVGPLLAPPVNVTAVARVAVRAATDTVFPPGIIDVYGISRYSQLKKPVWGRRF